MLCFLLRLVLFGAKLGFWRNSNGRTSRRVKDTLSGKVARTKSVNTSFAVWLRVNSNLNRNVVRTVVGWVEVQLRLSTVEVHIVSVVVFTCVVYVDW